MRGGLLGQGSILTVTSYANRTSPVLRGKWILENLLGTPCRRRRANVPPLPENSPGAKVLTMRERMVEHRANPVCASCHQLMDPVGSVDGELRRDRTLAHAERSRRADRRVRRASRRQHVRGRHRASQGGAEPAGAVRDDADREADDVRARPRARVLRRAGGSRRSRARARTDDYRFSSVVLGIVNSTPFQMRRSQVHDHHQDMALPRRTFLRGMGATLALPLLDAMVPALRRPERGGRSPVRRLGFVYIPMGSNIAEWMPKQEGALTELSPTLAPLTPFLKQHHRAQQPRAEERVFVGQSRDRELHVPERRESEDDRGLRLRDGRHGRSDCRAAARQGDAAAVARARDRLQLRGRQLRQRVQLRVHEHAGVVRRRRPRCRPKRTRAWCSSGCSATAARPPIARPSCARTAAFSTG